MRSAAAAWACALVFVMIYRMFRRDAYASNPAGAGARIGAVICIPILVVAGGVFMVQAVW